MLWKLRNVFDVFYLKYNNIYPEKALRYDATKAISNNVIRKNNHIVNISIENIENRLENKKWIK